jgi:hypothetical protein
MESLNSDIASVQRTERNKIGQFATGHGFGKRFKKGDPSPNPNGRRYPVAIIRENARAHAEDAVSILLYIAQDKNETTDDRIRACEQVLAWAFGMPKVATMVAFEVDYILQRLGLPKRSELRDKDGLPLFGKGGAYIPSPGAKKNV